MTVAAGAKGPLRATGAAAMARAASARLQEWWARDAARLDLWAPVALGAGAAAYLLLQSEPPFWLAPLAAAFAAAAIPITARRREALALALFAFGFFAADLRALLVEAPALRREIRFAELRGTIRSIDESPNAQRWVIAVESIESLPAERTPAAVRVTWRGDPIAAAPGAKVSMRATLAPPPPPAAPGGFDFARQLYFQGIGGVGYAVAPPRRIGAPSAAPLQARIESLRVALARRITAVAPGDAGAIVAALVTGKRAAISEQADAAFRNSGLAHLLSISGLHMGLATGLIFFGARAMLALLEPVALTRPIKKWAAGAALASGFLYLLISGGAWPAVRAFIMSSIVFLAIIADRRAISLRNVAIAAFVILLVSPEAVLHPGFQMSFAAVTALVAYYEGAQARADPARSFHWTARLRRYVLAIAATDIVASAATSPFALYHFNRAANFGLAANMVSVPLMGFWVMPAAIVALLLAPLGLDAPVWRLAAAGVDIILALANWTAGLPGAVTVFPQWPPAALGVITLGGLWLCLMSAPWRWWGAAALPAAALIAASAPQASVYVSAEGDNAALVASAAGGRTLAVFDRRRSRFDRTVWMEEAGIDSERSEPAALRDIARCDAVGCAAESGGLRIAFLGDRIGLDDDCFRADLVIAFFPVAAADRAGCAAGLIDRRDVWRGGAHAVYLHEGEIRIVTAAERRGARPWTGAP
jgi:competence protein ComEC